VTAGQDALRAALLDPGRAVPAGLTDGRGGPAGRRFDVYRNNVVAALAGGLATAFPAVAAVLGRERFRALAVAHVRAHPPRTALMMRLGGDLPAFLDRHAPADAPWLGDLARLEIAVRESYHAADAAPCDAAALGALPEGRLERTRLRLAPATGLVAASAPVVALRAAALAGAPLPAGGAEVALVTRPGFDPRIDALDPAGGAFVAALAGGAPLGRAAEAAARRDAGFDPTAALSALLAGHAIIALEEDPEP